MYQTHTEPKYPGHSSPGGSEPMTLGSPVSSPKSHQLTYLPSYLIGDINTSISPTSAAVVGWNSPSRQSSFQSLEMSHNTSRKALYQSPNTSALISSPRVGKSGGPPVQSLFDAETSHCTEFPKIADLSQTSAISTKDNTRLNGSVISNNNQSFSFNQSSFMSPAQIDPFYTQGEAITSNANLDESWVTIFGFPPAATSYILQQFTQYGKIIDQKTATSGNWIHIKYQSKLQAKKALSKNGKIFGGNIMIGVKPCIEMDVMNELGKENTNEDTNANFCQDVISPEHLASSKRNLQHIRPLTQIYKSPASETQVTQRGQAEPKSSSLVSKAMGYVFKW